MAQARAVKKSGKKMPRRSNPLAAGGRAAAGGATAGGKATKKSFTAGTAAAGRKAVSGPAAGPLPRKASAQKKRAARTAVKPLASVGERERGTTVPATPVAAGAAPAAIPGRRKRR